MIFPICPSRYRVFAYLPASGAEKPQTLEQVQATIDRRGPGNAKAYDPIWLAGFRINGRKVSNYRWAAPASGTTPRMSIVQPAAGA